MTLENRPSSNSDGSTRSGLFETIAAAVADAPAGNSAEAWARTTAGVVAMLLCLQLVTGILLAFYYVPSTDTAHTTVTYVEKVVASGAWIRSLHHYGSQWLTLILVLHIGQLLWRESYFRRPVGWFASILLLALVLAGGATGFSLPWDVRAFFATKITENMAAGLPVVGPNLRQWLLGGSHISPATLARFFAIHALVLPTLVLFVACARLFVLRDPGPSEQNAEPRYHPDWARAQFTRNMISAGLVFLALALFAVRYHAPFGPPAESADATYLPRPGPQFLWLFELLKLLPGSIASVVGTAFPGLVLLALASLPFVGHWFTGKSSRNPIPVLYLLVLVFVAGLTAATYIQDARDPQVRDQLARQAEEEKNFLAEPFQPKRLLSAEEIEKALAKPSPSPVSTSQTLPAKGDPPQSYIANCAQCHGFRGEGTALFPKLLGVSSKPRRTMDDLIKLLDDPVAYGLRPPMKSFAGKLTDQEKQEIAAWVGTLPAKKR